MHPVFVRKAMAQPPRAWRAASAALLAATALASCGLIYTPQRVADPRGLFTAHEVAFDIEVIAADQDVVAFANLAPFAPAPLPSVLVEETYLAGGSLEEGDATGATLHPTGRRISRRHIPPVPAPTIEPPHYTPPLETGLPRSPAEPYRIGVADVLLIKTDGASLDVSGLGALATAEAGRRGYVVQSNGAIAIPDVGEVIVGGLTLSDATKAVTEKLLERRIDPSFSLEVAEFLSQRATIGGAVRSPGALPITLRPTNLREALDQVGGLDTTQLENFGVRILRNGRQYGVSAEELYDRSRSDPFYLRDGDVIFVETLFDRGRADAFFGQQMALRNAALADLSLQLALVNFDNAQTSLEMSLINFENALTDRDRAQQIENLRLRRELRAETAGYVFLTGELRKPGQIELPYARRMSLAEALLGEAGLSPETGDPSMVYVLRSWKGACECDVAAYRFDFANALNMPLATRFEMRPDDIVFVQAHPVTDWSREISQLATVVGFGTSTIDWLRDFSTSSGS